METEIFCAGVLLGVITSGMIRLSFGRFVIYTSERGWVWEWARFDEEDKRIMGRISEAYDLGVESERYRLAPLFSGKTPNGMVVTGCEFHGDFDEIKKRLGGQGNKD